MYNLEKLAIYGTQQVVAQVKGAVVIELYYISIQYCINTPIFSGVHVTRSLVLYVCFVDRCLSFCHFFFWPLCSLFFFDKRIMIVPLVSSDSSNSIYTILYWYVIQFNNYGPLDLCYKKLNVKTAILLYQTNLIQYCTYM
jgi:hypothetical protein